MKRKQKINKKDLVYIPEVEDKKNFIGYDTALYAYGDIPLKESQKRIPSPKEIWKDFDSYSPALEQELLLGGDGECHYIFTAQKINDEEKLSVDVLIQKPEYEVKRAILVVNEYGKSPQFEVIQRLAKDGYLVCVPDYCGCFDGTSTHFPAKYDYGKVGNEGTHAKGLVTDPKETCPYLYTMILRRTLTFIEEEFHISSVALLGIKNGVEYAMQVAGTDDRICALGCICGCGYTDFLSIPFYGSAEYPIDKANLMWFTDVAGVSYLKNTNIPVFVALGSNGTQSDIDRLGSLSDIVGSDNFHFCISNGFSDNIDKKSFLMLLTFFRLSFIGASLPAPPEAIISVKDDGSVYAEITIEPSMALRTVKVYYCFNDNNHCTRCWNEVECLTAGKGEYLAKLDIYSTQPIIYFYIDAIYENGTVISGLIRRLKLVEKQINIKNTALSAFIFYYGKDDNKFHELDEDHPVIWEQGLTEYTVPIGLKGIVYPKGKMSIYLGIMTSLIDKNKILQIDSFSPKNAYTLSLLALDSEMHEYRFSKKMESYNTFETALLNCSDFKDQFFRPLSSWNNIKVLRVEAPDIVISKILFV